MQKNTKISNPKYIRGSRDVLGFDMNNRTFVDENLFDLSKIHYNKIPDYILKICKVTESPERLILRNAPYRVLVAHLLNYSYNESFIPKKFIDSFVQMPDDGSLIYRCMESLKTHLLYFGTLRSDSYITKKIKVQYDDATISEGDMPVLYCIKLCLLEHCVCWHMCCYYSIHLTKIDDILNARKDDSPACVEYYRLMDDIFRRGIVKVSYNLKPEMIEIDSKLIPDPVLALLDENTTCLSGGSVLDILFGGTSKDYDIYTTKTIEEIDELLAPKKYKLKKNYYHMDGFVESDNAMNVQRYGEINEAAQDLDIIFMNRRNRQNVYATPGDFIWQEFDFSHVKNWISRIGNKVYANLMYPNDVKERKFSYAKHANCTMNKNIDKSIARKEKYEGRGWTYYGPPITELFKKNPISDDYRKFFMGDVIGPNGSFIPKSPGKFFIRLDFLRENLGIVYDVIKYFGKSFKATPKDKSLFSKYYNLSMKSMKSIADNRNVHFTPMMEKTVLEKFGHLGMHSTRYYRQTYDFYFIQCMQAYMLSIRLSLIKLREEPRNEEVSAFLDELVASLKHICVEFGPIALKPQFTYSPYTDPIIADYLINTLEIYPDDDDIPSIVANAYDYDEMLQLIEIFESYKDFD
jgi:hypothetical protein